MIMPLYYSVVSCGQCVYYIYGRLFRPLWVQFDADWPDLVRSNLSSCMVLIDAMFNRFMSRLRYSDAPSCHLNIWRPHDYVIVAPRSATWVSSSLPKSAMSLYIIPVKCSTKARDIHPHAAIGNLGS
jgi:hypothetical protein